MTGLALPSPYTWQPGDIGSASLLNGQVRDPILFLLNPPLLQVSQSSAQSIANVTPTVLQLQNLIADTYGGWNASTWTYTIPIAGWYDLDMVAHFAANATGVRYVQLTQNGTASTIAISQVPGNAAATSADVSIPIQFAAGDTVQMRVNQTSGGALSTQASGGFNSSLSMRWRHA